MSNFLIQNGIHINFDESCNEKCLLHFLTHIDSDAILPTIPDNVNPIYTSKFNAWILEHKYKVDPLKIMVLPVETPLHFVHKELNLEFKITLFDANHSPGSVMFLFESKSLGVVLYTGNFCYKPSLLSSAVFKHILAEKRLTQLYLDVTHLKVAHEMPTKRVVIHRVVNLIKSYPGHKICIFMKDLFIDNVLNEIATKLKEPIYVNNLKMEMLKSLNLQDGFVTGSSKARVYGLALDANDLIQLRKINMQTNVPVLKILLSTSLYLTSNMEEMQSVHSFTYRTHSSPEELRMIIKRLQPEEVLPISQADDAVLQDFLKQMNYHNMKNNGINKDFWKHIGSLENLFNSTVFKYGTPVNLATSVTIPTPRKNIMETISISDQSSAIGSIASKTTLLRNNNLSTNDFNLNVTKEKCSNVNNLPTKCSDGDCTSIVNSRVDYSALGMKENTSNHVGSNKSDKEVDSDCSNSSKICHMKRGIKREKIKSSKFSDNETHDLKKTLLNLKYKVEVCNIVESVNFLQTLGLRPTWKNKSLYKSPERLTRLIRESRRKPHQNPKPSENIERKY